MKLYSAWYCPFAQRAWMALVHKGIDFEYVEVDPYDETEWWLDVSRGTAMVPVLIPPKSDGESEQSIVESSRVVEYLDDYQPTSQPLFSSNPAERAEQKYWMDHIGNTITPYFYRFLAAFDEGEFRDESRQKLIAGLRAITASMSDKGPLFSGNQVSTVDVSLISFAYRIDVLLRHYRDFALPDDDEVWQRYRRWYQHMLNVPAFKATANEQGDYDQRLIEFYLPYSKGEGQANVTEVNS